MSRTYDDWKTTDPRDMEPPEKPERDPDEAYDEARDEQLRMETEYLQRFIDRNEQMQKEIPRQYRTLNRQQLDQIFDILRDIEATLDERADVDDGIPNDAMRMLVGVRDVIRKLEGR